MIKSVIAGAGIAAVLFAVPLSAQAKDADVARASVAADSLNCNGCVWQTQIADPVEKVLRTPTANSVWSYALNPNIVTEEKLAPEVRTKLNAPDEVGADVKGAVLVSQDFEPKAIADCGGSFKTRKTKLGEFTLPVGDNLKIDSYLFGARTTSGADTTIAQLALRVGASDTVFGDDYGTVLTDLPAHANREITGSTFYVAKHVTEPTTVEVFGFCYNDDDAGSDAGSGQWTAAARVAVTQG